jgi:hypothetical protein
MTWLQKIVAALFVVLWLPTTMHCSLEKLPGLEFLHCSSDTATADCKDECQTIESGLYKVSDHPIVVPAPVLGFVCAVLVDVRAFHEVACTAINRCADSPPDLPQRWQFLLRTATPARAPSCLS